MSASRGNSKPVSDMTVGELRYLERRHICYMGEVGSKLLTLVVALDAPTWEKDGGDEMNDLLVRRTATGLRMCIFGTWRRVLETYSLERHLKIEPAPHNYDVRNNQ